MLAICPPPPWVIMPGQAILYWEESKQWIKWEKILTNVKCYLHNKGGGAGGWGRPKKVYGGWLDKEIYLVWRWGNDTWKQRGVDSYQKSEIISKWLEERLSTSLGSIATEISFVKFLGEFIVKTQTTLNWTFVVKFFVLTVIIF